LRRAMDFLRSWFQRDPPYIDRTSNNTGADVLLIGLERQGCLEQSWVADAALCCVVLCCVAAMASWRGNAKEELV